ncbi:MAG: aminomethyl-transferring glycine dehydrogenase subunit GcvPA [Deltaproteobacteria bacterium]|nr:aminomethyl-transferring glycine dehydrogenase subunit GcvPA [Deltaproteobacteria bacterium]
MDYAHYIPHTPDDEKKMLKAVGVSSLNDLFADIPSELRLTRLLNLPAPRSEQEVFGLMHELGNRNVVPEICLMGAGAYHHYIPSVVGHILSRSEFYTAYTPYQAEISQGILQAIYEYQTMIARLTGLDVANASMYDGASAMAEAVILATKTLNRRKIIMMRSIHPEYRQVVRTYARANGYEVLEAPFGLSGQADGGTLQQMIDRETAAVVLQSPNFFGVIEDLRTIAPLVHEQGALLVSGFTEATSLGILWPPGEMGADLVVGEGQALGNPLNFGGPYLGIFAARDTFLRKIPGRLAGTTTDKDGRRGFVLTLQTREQHIRREKATSNICSNEALCALAAAVYLACLGKNLRRLAEINLQKAHYLKTRLSELRGWAPVFPGPVYNEFLMVCPDPQRINQKLQDSGIIGGYIAGNDYPELKKTLLLCATEMLSKRQIDKLIGIIT